MLISSFAGTEMIQAATGIVVLLLLNSALVMSQGGVFPTNQADVCRHTTSCPALNQIITDLPVMFQNTYTLTDISNVAEIDRAIMCRSVRKV